MAATVEEMVRSIMADQQTGTADKLLAEKKARESMEATIAKLRMELEEREEGQVLSSSVNWSQEVSDLLEEIQRECNAAFERGRQRRKSPRTVFLHPLRHDNNFEMNDDQDDAFNNNHDILLDFQPEENWEMNATDYATASQVSLLDFDLSKLAETEDIINGL